MFDNAIAKASQLTSEHTLTVTADHSHVFTVAHFVGPPFSGNPTESSRSLLLKLPGTVCSEPVPLICQG